MLTVYVANVNISVDEFEIYEYESHLGKLVDGIGVCESAYGNKRAYKHINIHAYEQISIFLYLVTYITKFMCMCEQINKLKYTITSEKTRNSYKIQINMLMYIYTIM